MTINSDSYFNSASLAYACPPIRVSHPAALDNTERFSFDEQRVIEPEKEVLCFDCQKVIAGGKGVQVHRALQRPTDRFGDPKHYVPIHTLVHPECNHEHVAF